GSSSVCLSWCLVCIGSAFIKSRNPGNARPSSIRPAAPGSLDCTVFVIMISLDAMSRLTKNDWKGLWAILWRVLIFGPIVWVFGLALLMLLIAAFVGPPLYAAVAFFIGDYLFGITALVAWFVFLSFRRPLLRWTLEGIEYGGI